MKVKVAESVDILNLLSIVDDWLLNLRCHDIQNVSDHFQNLTNSSPIHSQECFSFNMPSDLWRKRVSNFESKFTAFNLKL